MPSHVARAFSYDPAERRLDVRFTSGRDYSYYDVPPDVFEAMTRAFAKGVLQSASPGSLPFHPRGCGWISISG